MQLLTRTIEKTFSRGNYNIKLVVKDSEDLVSEDEINLMVMKIVNYIMYDVRYDDQVQQIIDRFIQV